MKFLLAVTWIVGPAYNGAYQIPTSEIKAECNYTCSIYSAWPSPVTQKAVGVLTVVLEYVIPLTILTFCYLRMTIALQSIDLLSSRGPNATNQQSSIAGYNRTTFLSICYLLNETVLNYH